MRVHIALGVALSLFAASLPGAQVPADPAATTGLLVVAHGGGAEWNAPVRETVAQVRWPHGPVRVAFLMGPEARTAGWDAGIDSLVAAGATRLVVVPLMVSTHGAHYEEVRYYTGVTDSAEHHADHVRRRPPGLPVRVTTALDSAAAIGEILAERWHGLSDAARRGPVLLVAHGPSDDAAAERWSAALAAAAAPLRAAGAPAVRVGLLRDDAPAPVRAAAIAVLRDTVAALARASGDSVTVLPVLISSGSINRVTIPRDLEGLPVRYFRAPLAPHPALARWIARVAEAERLAAR